MRIYAASANGGVWFSANGGDSWNPLGGVSTAQKLNAGARSINSLAVGCLHVVFGNTQDDDIVFVGTGEPYYDEEAGECRRKSRTE